MDNEFSVQRYVLNIFVRSTFFLFPVPLELLKNVHFFYPWRNMIPEFIPVGLTIFVIGGLVGGILDIILPRKYVIGGKIATKFFNIGTFSFFEGIQFNVKVNVGASGKGIAVKDHRE